MIPTSIPSPAISHLNLGLLQVHIFALCLLAGINLAILITGKRKEPAGHHRSSAVGINLGGCHSDSSDGASVMSSRVLAATFTLEATRGMPSIRKGGIAMVGAEPEFEMVGAS